MSIPQSDLKYLWESGLSLEAAVIEYIDIRKIKLSEKIDASPLKATYPNAAELINAGQDLLAELRKVTLAHELLLHKLTVGELKAIGLLSPRQHPASPEEIERDVWKYENVDWKNSIVEADGLKFTSVRVIKNYRKQGRTIWPARAKHLKQGRPSAEDAIMQAYSELKSGFDFSQPFYPYVKPIQDRARKIVKIKDDTGIKEKTIKKYLSKLYQSDKKRKIQKL